MRRRTASREIWDGPVSRTISASCPSGTRAPPGARDGHVPEALDRASGLVVEANGEGEATLALEDRSDDLARPRRLDRVEDVAHRDAVARAAVAVDLDAQHGKARVCSSFTSAAPGTPPTTRAISSPFWRSVSRSSPKSLTPTSDRTPAISSLKRISIGCVNEKPDAGHGLAEGRLHLLDELALGPGRGPLGLRLQDHEDVARARCP